MNSTFSILHTTCGISCSLTQGTYCTLITTEQHLLTVGVMEIRIHLLFMRFSWYKSKMCQLVNAQWPDDNAPQESRADSDWSSGMVQYAKYS